MRPAKPKKTAQEQLAGAYLERHIERIRQGFRDYFALLELDPRVAKAAVRVFGSIENAMAWLVGESFELPGVPIEWAATYEGANKVLSVLHRLGLKMKRPLTR